MKPIMQRILPILLGAAMLLGIAQPAFAADETPPAPLHYDAVCEDGQCTVNIPLENLPLAGRGATFALTALEKNIHFLPGGMGMEIQDDLVLRLPMGNLELVNASLDLELNAANQVERLHGVAQIPLASLGLPLGNGDASLLWANVGLERGAVLADLGLDLEPEQRYLYLQARGGPGQSAPTDDADFVRPNGQQLTLVIDPAKRFVHLGGTVSMSVTDQLALFELFTGSEIAVPELLPLSERATARIALTLSDRLDQAALTVEGGYVVHSGLAGRLLRVEFEPLALGGGLDVNGDGLRVRGLVTSHINPEQIYDGALQAEFFLPFSTDLRTAYVEFQGKSAVPAAGIDADGVARLEGGQVAETVARAVKRPAPDTVVVDEAVADAAADAAGDDEIRMRVKLGQGLAWMGSTVQRNAQEMGAATARTTGAGWDATVTTWCRVTSLCAQENEQAVDAVAME